MCSEINFSASGLAEKLISLHIVASVGYSTEEEFNECSLRT